MGLSSSRSCTTVVANGYYKDIFVGVSYSDGKTKPGSGKRKTKSDRGIKRKDSKLNMNFRARFRYGLPNLKGGLRFKRKKLKFGSKKEEKSGSSHQSDGGYTRIQPGEAFPFNNDKSVSYVYVTIYKMKKRLPQKKMITENLRMPRKYNLVVNSDGYARNTKKGETWVDTNGIDHLEIYQNRIKETH